MESKNYNKHILALSLPLALLLIVVSASGLLIPGTYFMETQNWTSQSMGQDVVDLLLIAPLLIITTALASKRNKRALIIWGGINLYLIYTFIIYCFDIHFNRLFIVYCIILGLAFYSFLYFMFLANYKTKEFIYNKVVVRITAIYLIVVSGLFYFLWLSKIIPTIGKHSVPTDLIETGLTSNPVHVLDLAVFLPGFFLVALFLLRRKPVGFLLAPVLLVFSVLMDITIGGLTIGMVKAGVATDYSVAIVMGFLTLLSLFLLIIYFKATKENNSG